MLQAKVKTAPQKAQKQYATLDTRKVVSTPEPIMISRYCNILFFFLQVLFLYLTNRQHSCKFIN